MKCWNLPLIDVPGSQLVYALPKMAHRHHVEGYDAFCKFITELECDKGSNNIYVLFSGSKLPNGVNWCNDCIEAQPFINEAVNTFGTDTHFVYVEVGQREYWKDPACPFRKDPRLKLMVIPTIMKWKTPRRLEGVEQCSKLELLELIFGDDD